MYKIKVCIFSVLFSLYSAPRQKDSGVTHRYYYEGIVHKDASFTHKCFIYFLIHQYWKHVARNAKVFHRFIQKWSSKKLFLERPLQELRTHKHQVHYLTVSFILINLPAVLFKVHKKSFLLKPNSIAFCSNSISEQGNLSLLQIYTHTIKSLST